MKTHGLSKSPEYKVYWAMRNRCEVPGDIGFHKYGAKGIKVCDRWRDSFENFYADMGPRPSQRHSIDRKDGCGDYTPGNCRWATEHEQKMNRRNTVFLTVGGVTKTMYDWAKERGVSYRVFQNRLAEGWGHERIVATPTRSVSEAMRDRWARRKAQGLTTHWRTKESYRQASDADSGDEQP